MDEENNELEVFNFNGNDVREITGSRWGAVVHS